MLLVFIEKQGIVVFNGVLGVQDLGEVERYPDVNVGGCGCVTSNIFEKEFLFHELEALRVNELWVQILGLGSF